MANKYSAEERAEALKLADEIGAMAAVRRLARNADTISMSPTSSIVYHIQSGTGAAFAFSLPDILEQQVIAPSRK